MPRLYRWSYTPPRRKKPLDYEALAVLHALWVGVPCMCAYSHPSNRGNHGRFGTALFLSTNSCVPDCNLGGLLTVGGMGVLTVAPGGSPWWVTGLAGVRWSQVAGVVMNVKRMLFGQH